jgi:hypothetical protein
VTTPETILALAGVTSDQLGEAVRAEWVSWAAEQPDADQHPGWLTPWHELPERDRQVDRYIGIRLFCAGWLAGHGGRAAWEQRMPGEQVIPAADVKAAGTTARIAGGKMPGGQL